MLKLARDDGAEIFQRLKVAIEGAYEALKKPTPDVEGAISLLGEARELIDHVEMEQKAALWPPQYERRGG